VVRRVALVVSLLVLVGVGAGPAAAQPTTPGTPPKALSPIAASVYRAQFALCSLDTIYGLAGRLGINVTSLSPERAAARLAAAKERSLGSAARIGCKGGLLYRNRTDQTIAAYHSRLKADNYVAAAYIVIVAAFFLYVFIHALKISQLKRSLESLAARVGEPDEEHGAANTPD
jgi:hypothetical protein